MCGDPILLRIFAATMGMSGGWKGLPFYVAAVCPPPSFFLGFDPVACLFVSQDTNPSVSLIQGWI